MEDTKKIYVLPSNLSKNYLQDIKNAAIKNKFQIEDKFNLNEINIVVSNLEDLEQIKRILYKNSNQNSNINLVNLKWLIDSNKSGKLCDYLNSKYQIGKTEQQSITNPKHEFEIPDYECQRSTPLIHFNKEFTDPLEILEEYAEFKSAEIDMSRALAFRRSICVLKSLPFKLTNINQLKNAKHIGEHTKAILQEILNYGSSKEVDLIKSQEYYQTVKKFNSIYGCGAIISNRLFEFGFKTVESLRENYDSLCKRIYYDTERFKYGLTYFDDLVNKKITKPESDFIFKILKNRIENVKSDCIIELMGGFKRGKPYGHDIDILITHPNLGEEKELLEKIIKNLEIKGYVIYGTHDKPSNSDWAKSSSKSIMDHFEKYICILKFPIFDNDDLTLNDEDQIQKAKKLKTDNPIENEENLEKILTCLDATKFKRKWIARRVDLIVCPINQFPFAILGWTGSRQFNRSIRLYADKEFGYKLSSHGLYDQKKNTLIEVKSEKEIFEILKLKYLEPCERNC